MFYVFLIVKFMIRQIIKKEDIALLKYTLNNVDIKYLEKKFIHNIGPFRGIEYNGLLMPALKQKKSSSLLNYLPDNNQLFFTNYVFENRINHINLNPITLDWIINNP
jgi:hypothetical protein